MASCIDSASSTSATTALAVDAAGRHQEPERRRGHALLVAVRLRRQHVQIVQRQRAGDAAERAGRVGTDGDELIAVEAHPHLAGAHARQHLARGEQPPGDLVDRAATQHVADPFDQIGHQLGLPWAPRGGSRGQRVGLGQRAEQLERAQVADGLGDGGQRGRVGQIAARGDIGQQQVMAHQRGQHLGVLGRQPHARPDGLHQRNADLGVVAGVALADVVEQRAEHQQVGAVHSVGHLRCLGDCFPRVPIDGVAVVHVPLRPSAHRRPLGQQPHDEPGVIERFPHRDGALDPPAGTRRTRRQHRPATDR